MNEPTNAEIKEDTKELVQEVHDNPSNADLMIAVHQQGDNLKEHAQHDEQFAKETTQVHKDQAVVNKKTEESLASIHIKLKDIPNKEETAEIVEAVIKKQLLNNGKTIYQFIIASSLFIGALVVIGGGFKVVLGWLGFTMLSK